MIILSKLADYGVIVASHLAAATPAQETTGQIATATRLSSTTVAKVLKLLAKAEIVKAARGAAGGYRLARAAADISVAEIVAAIDGAFAITQCTGHAAPCDRIAYCGTRPHWTRINQAIGQALDSIGLDEMVTRPPTVPTISVKPASAALETHLS